MMIDGECDRILGQKSNLADAQQLFQAYLDKSTPFTVYRWVGTGVLFLLFALRIFVAQGWYIGTLPLLLCSQIPP